jgi:hypothetical protein
MPKSVNQNLCHTIEISFCKKILIPFQMDERSASFAEMLLQSRMHRNRDVALSRQDFNDVNKLSQKNSCYVILDAISIVPNLGLCREHQCYAAFGPGQQCPNKILEGQIFCQNHNCSAPDCQMVKELGPDQKYCLSHACFICLEQNMVNFTLTDSC